MSIIKEILKEYALATTNFFPIVFRDRYGFIERDSTKFKTYEEKKSIIDKLESYRNSDKLKSKLPIKLINSDLLVATQTTVDSDNLVKVSEVEIPAFCVKLNGVYFLLDGHHRSSGDILKGEKEIECYFMDLDN